MIRIQVLDLKVLVSMFYNKCRGRVHMVLVYSIIYNQHCIGTFELKFIEGAHII